eukprot:5907227-Amphidinium_carterae.1
MGHPNESGNCNGQLALVFSIRHRMCWQAPCTCACAARRDENTVLQHMQVLVTTPAYNEAN